MAAVPWIFESGYLESRTLAEAYKIKIEVAYQVTTETQWGTGLDAPDFSTGVATGDFSAWAIPKIPRVSSPDLGAMGAASLSLTADNLFVGADGVDVATGSLIVGRWYINNGYDTVTHDSVDYVDGQYFQAVNANYATTGTGTVERYQTVWSILNIGQDYLNIYTVHVRISTMEYGGSYVVRFWGVLDPKSLELEVRDIDVPDEWIVKCRVVDCLSQLSQRTALQYMDKNLLHATFDYDISTNVFLTGVSTYTDGSLSIGPGRYFLSQFVLPKVNASDGDDWKNADNFRWIKIVDIFQSINDYLGYEGDVNDGGSWSDFHSWRFYYNTANSTGAGGTTLSYVGIDGLYVISQMNIATVINEQLTFFDPNGETAYSLKTMPSALEVLKKICVSFGCVARTKVNSSGELYLEVTEAAKESSTLSITDFSDVEEGIKIVPNEFAVDGIKVPSYGGGSDATRGNGESQNSVQFDTLFNLANNTRAQFEFKRKYSQGSDVSGAAVVNLRPGPDFFCSLWALTNITGTTAESAYSICAVMPLSDGSGASSDPGNVPDYGEYYGSTGTIYPPTNTPSTDYQYWLFVEVMAWALCHYMWNDVDVSKDAVGYTRPRGVRIELNKLSIDHTAIYEPPYLMEITLDGTDYEFLVNETEEDLENDEMKITGHTRNVL